MKRYPDGYASLLYTRVDSISAWFVEVAEATARHYLGPCDALPVERHEPELVQREDYNTLVRLVRRLAGR